MTASDAFTSQYNSAPDGELFCPYRVCPLGAHIDHQHGVVTGFALDRGITVCYRARVDTVLSVKSAEYPNSVDFDLSAPPRTKLNDWADYLRGAAKILSENHTLGIGLDAFIVGSLPVGGLSSSAAVTISFIGALCRVNHITLSDRELIYTALRAENEFVGVSCGKLDQSTEVLSRRDMLLKLDTADDSYELIAPPLDMKPYKILILFSGIERALVSSGYNGRVEECRLAAKMLKIAAGIAVNDNQPDYLRDVQREIFDAYGGSLPENLRRRALHFYTECERIRLGTEAWRNGSIEKFGSLCTQSGQSSIENYEAGSPELTALYNIIVGCNGVYGGRFSGAGFKGACMALIDPFYADDIQAEIEARYTAAFPMLKGKYASYICNSGDGAGENSLSEC